MNQKQMEFCHNLQEIKASQELNLKNSKSYIPEKKI